MMRVVFASLTIASVAQAAAAQSQSSPACKDGAMPFEATAANRLTGAQLQAAVAGKRLGYLRESLRNPGMLVNNMRDLRADGSFVYTCEFARSPDGPWRKCGSFGSVEKRVAGDRDVGVWSINNNAVCATKSAFGPGAEDCFAIHRQGTAVAAKRVSGPLAACVQGAITLQ